MGVKTIAVCDGEPGYVKKFIRRAAAGQPGALKFIGITKPAGMDRIGEPDIWILGRSFWEKRFISENRDKCILLCGDEMPSGFGEISCVFKYAPTKNIFQEIYKSSAWEKNIPEASALAGVRGRTLFLCAPAGHPENSCYSLALSNILGEESDVLYINAYGNPDFTMALDIDGGETVSDLLVRLRRGYTGVDVRRYLREFGNTKILLPIRQTNQSAELDGEELKELLEFLKSGNMFDFIVLDAPGAGRGLQRLFAESDISIIISGEGTMEKVSRGKFLEELKIINPTKKVFSFFRSSIGYDSVYGAELAKEIMSGQYRRVAQDFMNKNGGEIYRE